MNSRYLELTDWNKNWMITTLLVNVKNYNNFIRIQEASSLPELSL